MVDTWPLDGRQLGVRLTGGGERFVRHGYEALEPWDVSKRLGPDVRTRLIDDLEACARVLRPRPTPRWLPPF